MHINADRQNNSRIDDYIHQTDKITAGQLHINASRKAEQMNISNRQDNIRTDAYRCKQKI